MDALVFEFMDGDARLCVVVLAVLRTRQSGESAIPEPFS